MKCISLEVKCESSLNSDLLKPSMISDSLKSSIVKISMVKGMLVNRVS